MELRRLTPFLSPASSGSPLVEAAGGADKQTEEDTVQEREPSAAERLAARIRAKQAAVAQRLGGMRPERFPYVFRPATVP